MPSAIVWEHYALQGRQTGRLDGRLRDRGWGIRGSGAGPPAVGGPGHDGDLARGRWPTEAEGGGHPGRVLGAVHDRARLEPPHRAPAAPRRSGALLAPGPGAGRELGAQRADVDPGAPGRLRRVGRDLRGRLELRRGPALVPACRVPLARRRRRAARAVRPAPHPGPARPQPGDGGLPGGVCRDRAASTAPSQHRRPRRLRPDRGQPTPGATVEHLRRLPQARDGSGQPHRGDRCSRRPGRLRRRSGGGCHLPRRRRGGPGRSRGARGAPRRRGGELTAVAAPVGHRGPRPAR